jgi:hypothetical protein
MGSNSQIEFLYQQFWGVLVTNHALEPNFTDLYFTVLALVKSEKKINTEFVKKLKYIEETATEKIGMPLAQIEYFYWKNASKGLMTDLSLRDGVDMNIMEIYSELCKAQQEMVSIVVEIGKRYSLDIEYSPVKKKESDDD